MTAQAPKKLGISAPADQKNLSNRVAEAKAAVAALGEQFTSFVEGDIRAIEAALEKAKANEGRRMDRIREIFEVAHNVKGQGASFGYDLLTEVAHLLCLRTRDVGHVNNEALDAIGFHVKALRVIVNGKISGKGGEKGKVLLEKLNSLPGDGLDGRL